MEWIAVKDKLPIDDNGKLVADDGSMRWGNLSSYGLGWYNSRNKCWVTLPVSFYVTHWMPLPEPPEIEE